MRLIVNIADQSREYELREGTSIIGRDHSCDIRIPEPSLSRRHIECVLRQGQLTIRDLDTKNGTFIGVQRIREANIRPGVRVRASNVWLRFEESAPQPATQPPPPREPEPLEHLIPRDAAYEEDEEPTPLDASFPEQAGAEPDAEGARLVVRGERWFVRDQDSGVEVEIVPVQQPPEDTAPAPSSRTAETHPAGLPAVIRPGVAAPAAQVPMVRPAEPVAPGRARRGKWFLPLAIAAVLALTVAVVLLCIFLLPSDDKDKPISVRQYRAVINLAVRDFKQGKRSQALQRLRNLMKMPMRGRPLLAQMLLEAFQHDNRARRRDDFRIAWEDARQHWNEVHRSSESTKVIRDLAAERLRWLATEEDNMGRITDAKEQHKQGNLPKCFQYASEVTSDSMFREEAETLMAQAKDALVQAAGSAAAQAEKTRNWTEAVRNLRELAKYEPALAQEIDKKIGLLQQYENHRLAVGKARNLASQKNFAQALVPLASVPADSPYATETATLKARYTRESVLQAALAAYHAGNGEKALALLANAKLQGTGDYKKINAVLKARDKANEAERETKFYAAESAYKTILSLESNPNNFYVKTAKSKLANMPRLAKSMSSQLTREAERALDQRRFADARAKFNEAYLLDPANQDAIKGLDKLRDDAVLDYNRALWRMREDPESALKLLKDAKARVSPTDKYYRLADERIREIKATLEKKKP